MAAAIQVTPGVPTGPVEPDVQLMCRVRDGDANAYLLLVERYQRPLIHFLRRIVLTQHVAEELSQEVFLRVYRARERYQPTAKFSSWLFRIANHVAINWLRDRRCERNDSSLDQVERSLPLRQMADRSSNVEERLVASVKALEIRSAIDSLPPNQRAAVFMHKYQELEYSQIASTLHCSEGAVKSLLFRAYERLRARLAQFSF